MSESKPEKLLGAFQQAFEALGADEKLVGATRRVREAIPKLERLLDAIGEAQGDLRKIVRDFRQYDSEAEVDEEDE